jgi:hypothetical protein
VSISQLVVARRQPATERLPPSLDHLVELR